jgi:DNA repair exonuclease SbcCD nuclease subunit
MKISILSDFHFGFAYNSDLEEDSFNNVDEAMDRSLDSDLIIIAGDIFDTRAPKTQTWAQTMKILTKPLLKPNPDIKLVESTKDLKEISKRVLNHLPLIAIHGNHERRAKNEINPVETLENAGILIYLHCNTMVFEKDGIKVAIHGMSSVSERTAHEVLSQWNPQPLPDYINILLLHQNIDPYVYSPLEIPSLNHSNLPKGFDLIINGHIHTKVEENINGTKFMIPGSLTITQFQRGEAENEKCFIVVNIDKERKISTEFVPLEKNRKFFYEEIKIDGPMREQIEKKINDIIYSRTFTQPPIIRLKITGKEIEVVDQELRELERKYLGKAILVFAKDLESPEITEKIEFLRNLREQNLSTEEIGLNILKKNLENFQIESDFDYEDFFKLLSEGEVDNAFNILIGEQKTLRNIR